MAVDLRSDTVGTDLGSLLRHSSRAHGCKDHTIAATQAWIAWTYWCTCF